MMPDSTTVVPLPARRTVLVLVLLLIGVGLGINVRFAAARGHSLAVYNLGVDSGEYHALGQAFSRSLDPGVVPESQPPAFVMALGAAYRSGLSVGGVKVLLCILVAATALMAWWIGARLDPLVGAIAAALVSFSPMLRAYASTIQYEIPAAFLVTAVVLLTLRAGAEQSMRRAAALWVTAGLLCGLAALTREVLIVLLPVVLGAIALRRNDWSVAARGMVAVGVCAIWIALVGGWAGFQSSRAGHFVPISTKGPVNVRIGNNPFANGTYNLLASPIGEPSGFAFMRAHPAATVRLAVRKVLYFSGWLKDGWNVPRRSAIYLSRMFLNRVPLEVWLPLVRGGGLFALAALGTWLAARGTEAGRAWWPMPVIVVLIMATHVLAISSHRFAVPVLPVVAVLAAVPLGRGLRYLCTSRRAAPIGVVALLAAWAVASQFVRLPGSYTRRVAELDGDRIAYVTDPAVGRTAIFARASEGRRLIALDTTEHFPKGFIVVVADLRAGPFTVPARDDLEVASIIVSDEAGRRLCGAAVAARWFSPGGYQRIPARCELPPSGIVSVGVFTAGVTDLWLDHYSVRFDIPTIEDAVIPDAGPRRTAT